MAEPKQSKRPWASSQDADAGLPTQVGELWQLILTYAKQQTLDPLKSLGRFVAFGVAGALLIAIGCLLLAIGILRAVQAESGPHLTGDLSWIPYVAALAFCVIVVLAMARLIAKPPAGEER